MSNLINQEKRLLLAVSYAFVMGFATVGILLVSVFNNSIFIDLTFKFLLISAIPIVIIYRLDTIYNESENDEKYAQSHLAWIAFHYIAYCTGFLLDYLIVEPLSTKMNYDTDYFILVVYVWAIWKFIRGFNNAIEQKEAPKHYELLNKIRFFFMEKPKN